MKTKTKAYRHGEILFAKIDKLPKGLKETKTNQIMTGSHGNSHTYDNGKIYFTKNEDHIRPQNSTSGIKFKVGCRIVLHLTDI